jgi:23S rRNA (adenine2030-N6)-methyltransferase
LKQALPREAGAQVLKADGWTTAVQRTPPPPGRLLVLIDPPFEAADDYRQIVAVCPRILARNPAAVVAIWLPIKDLATYDAFLGDLEDAIGAAPAGVVEVRLRRPLDPMKMNGCAMVVVNPSNDLAARAAEAADWIARIVGDAGASSSAFAINAPASQVGDA